MVILFLSFWEDPSAFQLQNYFICLEFRFYLALFILPRVEVFWKISSF